MGRFPHLKLVNLEKESDVAKHQTGRNSGVIHSGIYYKPGSLKAKLCVEGRRLMWDYCDSKRIEYKGVGKLIVATEDSEIPLLMQLYARGQQNGVENIELLDAPAIAEREPHCRGVKAIFSPVTGIVDYTRVSHAYAGDIRERGGEILLSHEVTGFERKNGVTLLRSPAGDVEARSVITCAGVYSDKMAQMTGGARDPKIVPFRGDYLVLRPEKNYLVKGNIYPVPDPEFPFLGVHCTPRMDGSIWLGPNAVLAFAREGYRFFDFNPPELWDAITYPGFIKLALKYWQVGAGEMYRDLVRGAYVKALQRYIPELRRRRLPTRSLGNSRASNELRRFAGRRLRFRGRRRGLACPQRSLARGDLVAGNREIRCRRCDPPLRSRRRRGRVGMDLFVDAAWLIAHRNDPNLAIVDTRSTPHGAPGQTGPTGRRAVRRRTSPRRGLHRLRRRPARPRDAVRRAHRTSRAIRRGDR